jgi:DNA-directed RNA polymerase beta subunit
MNDAFVASSASMERGLFRSTFRYTMRAVQGAADVEAIPNPLVTARYKHGRYGAVSPDEHIVAPGTVVNKGDVVLARYTPIHKGVVTGTASSVGAAENGGGGGNNPSATTAQQGAPSSDDPVFIYQDTSLECPTQHVGPSRVTSVQISPIVHSFTFDNSVTSHDVANGSFGQKGVLNLKKYEIRMSQDIVPSVGDKVVVGSNSACKAEVTVCCWMLLDAVDDDGGGGGGGIFSSYYFFSRRTQLHIHEKLGIVPPKGAVVVVVA